MFVKGNRSLCLLMRPKPQVSYKKETKGPQRNPRNPQGLPQALKLGTTKRSTTVAVGNATSAPIGGCGGISDDVPLPMTGRPVPASSNGNRGWWATPMAKADCPLLNLPPSAYASRLSSPTSLLRQTVDRNAGMSLLADTANVINCSSAGEQRPSGALGNSSMLNIHELQQIQTGRDITCPSYSFHPQASGTPTQPACDVEMSRSRISHHQGIMHYGNNGNAPSMYFDSLSSSAPLDVNVVPASSNESMFCYDDQEVARCRSASLGSTTYLPLVIGNITLAGILEQNLVMERETGWYRNQRIANYDCFSCPRTGR